MHRQPLRHHTACRLCRDIPADRDEVFSLHADAPDRRPFRCQTHSHCFPDAARLHPAAAPGPLRDPCPGQDPSLRGSCVLHTPAVLCGEPRMLLLLLLEDKTTSVKVDKVKYLTSDENLQNKVSGRLITEWWFYLNLYFRFNSLYVIDLTQLIPSRNDAFESCQYRLIIG